VGNGGGAGASAGGTGAGSGGIIDIDGSSGGSAGGSAGDSCASTEVTSTLTPANLYFVIDRSGSMNCNLPSDGQPSSQCEAFPGPINGNPTKWELTEAALNTAIDDLEVAGNISAGMVVFPRPNSDCAVTQTPDVAIATLNLAQNNALSNFLSQVDPKGKTPLAGALILSYAHLYDQIKAGALKGNVFVVLLTDGFETCKPSELPKLLGADMDSAEALNIRTFVIGVPGSEDGRATLSQMAWEGNTAKSPTCTHNPTPANVGNCHFDMTTSANFGQDLQAALAQISGTVLSCELAMPTAPAGKKIDEESVKVIVSGTEITKEEGVPCDNANGWQFSPDKTKVLLCGTACESAKQPSASIKIDLGCLSDIR
jgi:hypothetical protein